jgi:hypothetical protein
MRADSVLQSHSLMQRRLYILGQHHAGGWMLICLNLRLSATSITLADARDQLDQKIRAHLRLTSAERTGSAETHTWWLAWLQFFLCKLHLDRSTRRTCEVVDLRMD